MHIVVYQLLVYKVWYPYIQKTMFQFLTPHSLNWNSMKSKSSESKTH